MPPLAFLSDELHYAETQLARVRRIAAKMQADLESQGLDEVAVYERLAASRVHRQLQRDHAFYQQMCLRLHRHLARLPQAEAAPPAITPAATPLVKPLVAPVRPPAAPTRNQLCPCGSTVKYKRCCGNPLRQAAA